MLDRLTRRVLLQNLVLVWLGFACEATSLGLTVHVEPLESDGGNTVGSILFLQKPLCVSMSSSLWH